MLREHDAVWWQPTLWLPRLALTAASWWLPQAVDLCVMGLCVCAPACVCVCVRVHVLTCSMRGVILCGVV